MKTNMSILDLFRDGGMDWNYPEWTRVCWYDKDDNIEYSYASRREIIQGGSQYESLIVDDFI